MIRRSFRSGSNCFCCCEPKFRTILNCIICSNIDNNFWGLKKVFLRFQNNFLLHFQFARCSVIELVVVDFVSNIKKILIFILVAEWTRIIINLIFIRFAAVAVGSSLSIHFSYSITNLRETKCICHFSVKHHINLLRLRILAQAIAFGVENIPVFNKDNY